MSQGRLRAVVVGCRMGCAHAAAMAELEDYELVGLCDLEEATARAAAEQLDHPPVFTDVAAMLNQTRPAVVAIATPTSSHAELTVLAAEAGARGVYCEKPMATCLGDARRMVDSCTATSAVLAVNHQRRLSDPYLTMGRLLSAGEIGQPYLVRGSCAGDLLSDGTHTVDSLLHLTGDSEVRWVVGQVHRPPPDPEEKRGMGYQRSGGWRYGHPVEEGAMATFELADGMRAEMLCGDLRLPGRGYQDIEAFGAEGRLWRPGDQGDPPLCLWNGQTRGWQPVSLQDPQGRSAMRESYRAFARTIHEGTPHPLGSANALRGFEVVMALYESARLGAKLELPLKQERFPLELSGEALA